MNKKLKTLKDFQGLYINGFDSIAIDIVGYCNAKCKYCPAGNDLSNKGHYISLELYEEILKKLIEYKFYTSSTNYHIYCLGEPLLHPQINDLLIIMSRYGIRTSISTNASVVPEFTAEALECVDRFIISMPGFSQASYDRIHGFNFNKIQENISKLKSNVDNKANHSIGFDMSFHIYQFNESEMTMAKEYCHKEGIRFAPNFAVLIDKNKCRDYVTNKMDYQELKDISKDLFLGVLDEQIRVSPRNYCDFQQRFVSINVDGDIRICSSFNKAYEKNILIGNIVNDDINSIIYNKYNFPRCEECISMGLTLGKGYDCKVYPNAFYNLMKENEYLKSKISEGESIDYEIKLLFSIRLWEQENYSKDLLNDIINLSRDKRFSSELVVELIGKYCRFAEQTSLMMKNVIL